MSYFYYFHELTFFTKLTHSKPEKKIKILPQKTPTYSKKNNIFEKIISKQKRNTKRLQNVNNQKNNTP